MANLGRFLYLNKVIIFNLLLTAFIVGFNPDWLHELPDTVDFNFYLGVGLVVMLFFEFAGIYYKSLWIFSFNEVLHRKVPWYISITFFPRIAVYGGLATLAMKSMGLIESSDFALLLIVLYVVLKEFWVRSALLQTEREKGKRPSPAKVWFGEILIFLSVCAGYLSIWKIYLLENPRVYFMVLSPINWAFVALGFLILLYAIQMPYFWEEHLRTKPHKAKLISVLSLLLPTFGVLLRLYLIGFAR